MLTLRMAASSMASACSMMPLCRSHTAATRYGMGMFDGGIDRAASPPNQLTLGAGVDAGVREHKVHLLARLADQLHACECSKVGRHLKKSKCGVRWDARGGPLQDLVRTLKFDVWTSVRTGKHSLSVVTHLAQHHRCRAGQVLPTPVRDIQLRLLCGLQGNRSEATASQGNS